MADEPVLWKLAALSALRFLFLRVLSAWPVLCQGQRLPLTCSLCSFLIGYLYASGAVGILMPSCSYGGPPSECMGILSQRGLTPNMALFIEVLLVAFAQMVEEWLPLQHLPASYCHLLT